MKVLIMIFFMVMNAACFAQQADKSIAKGNEAYKKNDFNTAIENYKNALRQDPNNDVARFNLANAQEKKDLADESVKNYDQVLKNTDLNSLKSQSNYNKAITYLREQDLQHAIEAFKASLEEDPSDNDTRENLQKALNELKSKEQKSQPQPQNQPKKQKQPKQQPFDKNMMNQKFNELRNQEKQLQKKLQDKSNAAQTEEDW